MFEYNHDNTSMSSSSSSEEEWEDVESLPLEVAEEAEDSKATAFEIVISKGSKRGKKQNALEKALAAFNRDLRYNLHKTSLLCLLVQALYFNNHCNDPLLQARLFSLIPRDLHHDITDNKLHKILKWFVARKERLLTVIKDETLNEDDSAGEGVCGHVSAVEMLVAVLRVLGHRTRLVLALNPISFKPTREKMDDKEKSPQLVSKSPSKRRKDSLKESIEEEGSPVPGPMFFKLMQQLKEKEACDDTDGNMECCSSKMERGGELCASSSHHSGVVNVRRDADESETTCTKATGTLKNRKGCNRKGGKSTTVKGKGKRKSSESNPDGRGSVKKRKISQKDSPTSENDAEWNTKTVTGRNTRSKQKKREKQPAEKKTTTPTTTFKTSPYFKQEKTDISEAIISGSDPGRDSDDFQPTKSKQRLTFNSSDSDCGSDVGRIRKKKKTSKVKPKQSHQKIATNDIEGLESKENKYETGIYDESSSWAEVFVKEQKRYVSLHIPSSTVDQPKMCEKFYAHKISYIIAIDTRAGCPCVVDVTARYASDWCEATRRQRLSESWWRETFQPYSASRDERKMEDEDIMNILYSRPLPTSINDYKSHSLYVLRRHLLKFEAIYPVDSQILGYCRGEPVFSRNCVFTLHTRETWLKEGRVVKKDEEPYKVVKARAKKGQSSLERESSTVEVFGHWQTEVYIPPPVVDGVVPKNEYGNVELFQPSMLPAGASHIKIAGIHKVALKLGISYAPAMMGWDFHSGHCYPVIEGIVVAKENEEILLEAWRQEEQLIIEKQIKKREVRVLERWRKLTRGVLIRERVHKTYSLT